MRLVSLAGCLSLLLIAPASAADPVKLVSEGPVVISQAHQFVVHSPGIGRDFLIRVFPPTTPVPDGEKAGAVYMLDGNTSFGIATDVIRLQMYEGKSWPTYIISIGYDTTDRKEVMRLRELDYLHVTHEDKQAKAIVGGGGAAFEAFIMSELRPFIDQRHAIDPAKTMLAGHSYGGLFTANVLVRHPDAFAGYMISSPSVWADPELMQRASAFRNGGGKRVYLSVGGAEPSPMEPDAMALAAVLSKPETGLSVVSHVYPGQSHVAASTPWMADGLRYVLEKPAS